MLLQKIGRLEIDLRESYEALYQVQVDQTLVESVKENYRSQLFYWSEMELFKYHVEEEKLQLEIAAQQRFAAQLSDPTKAQDAATEAILEKLCSKIDLLQN